jgi:hypothetical protein
MTLQALVRNFLPINNVATWWSLALQRFLLHCVFSVFKPSLISLPLMLLQMVLSEVILNSVWKQKTHNGVRTPAVQDARVVKLSVAILVNYRFFCEGAVHKWWYVSRSYRPGKRRWYDSIPSYRQCCRHWRQPFWINSFAFIHFGSSDALMTSRFPCCQFLVWKATTWWYV